MVVSDASIHNIMGGMESTAGVRLHNHRRKLKQRFDIIKKLGQGTYGKVQLGINKETGQEVAIKTIKKAKIETDADLVRIRREIQIMSSVQHPNIIHIYEVFENREKMVLVMEYAAGGELYDFLSEKKVLAEDEARRIFRQIATAVYYCHKHKICHRDLKLENILLDEHGSAKIADFGLSNVFNEQRLLNTFCGSPLYASPEIVKGTPYHGPEVDCWSLGVLLYTLVYGAMPFDGSNFKRLVKQISQGDYFEPKKPSPASPLIREMLTVTPARRANIEKICAHWWVNEGHTDSCLDIAEELANQTPVRLDLLLSLAPPPPAVGSDMLLTDEQGGGDSQRVSSDALGPTRCHSVGSIMELDQPAADRRIKEFERQKQRGSIGDGTPITKDAPKRKLEEGISSEDVVHSVVKKKESCRRQDNEPSTSKASPPKTNNKSSPCMSTEEKMDVDVDISESGLSEVTAEISGAVADNSEVVKNVTEVTEGASAIINTGITEGTAQKPTEKESNKTIIGRDKTTRKSVKGSAKKSKQASTTLAENDAVPNKVLSNKDVESKSEAKENEDMVKVIENNADGSGGQLVEVSSEVNKEKESADATVTEAVKQKVKKKKKITSSKAEELPTEGSQKIVDEGGPCESSLELSDLKSKEGESSSQDSKNEFTNEEVTESETKDVSEISNNVTPVAKDVMSIKSTETSKTGSVRVKKPPGDLTISKMGSSSEKSSGSEEVTSPTKTVERRRSKIFENSEQFNIFLRGSEPKSTIGDKPKKVFIPGVKVSDYKQAFERRSSLSASASSLPIKSSTSKKSVEPNSTNAAPMSPPSDVNSSDEGKSLDAAELKSADKLKISGKSKEQISSISADATPSKQISKDENSIVNSIETNAVISKPKVNNEVPSDKVEAVETPRTLKDDDADLKLVPALQVTDKMSQQEKARIKKLKDAVDIISNAIAEETKRESGDSPPIRKISSTKPPVPGLIDKSKIKSAVNTSSSTKSPPATPSEKKAVHTQLSTDVKSDVPENVEKPAPEVSNIGEPVQKETDALAVKQVESDLDKNVPAKKKSSKVEITLKSATLPRRRTSKAEIQLGFPQSKPADTPAAGEYRTEVEHMVGNSVPSRLQTQRSEVAFPVAAAKNVQPMSIRSSSLEPEGTPKVKSKPREHIIPIQVEQEKEEGIRPPAAKPPVPPLQQQRSMSQRASSLSRQSTQDSDTDSTISVSGPEPIRKSPREYIIPIAVEGGGYVTPRAGSLEPSVSEASTETIHPRSSGRTSKLRKMGSLLSDSEDEGFNSPYVTLQRHSSVSREGDNPDDDRPFHRMHKLRSSKPRRATLEHNDSLSSAEEEDDDDDDGFEILTAESLFSTLLSRVRSLTQRLNVEDGGRTGFPSSRLMSHLGASGHNSPSSGFWSSIYGFPGDPLSRRVSESSQFGRPYGEGPTPWRRSVSRDTSEVDSVYSEGDGGTLPRGSSRFDYGSLSDDAGIDTSTSYYKPNLTRRMQQNWHSSSQNLGNLSALNRENSLSDNDWSMNYHAPSRKSSLGSLTSPNSNIPQHHSSRRLARTLSLHSRNEDRRNKDIQGTHAMDYSRSHPVRTDHYTPVRRSICSLDNRSFVGMPSYRSSSTSDSGIYNAGNRSSDLERVLPPLPYSAGLRERRKDSSKSSAYVKQHSLDINSSLHTGNDISYVPYSKGHNEALHGEPHHSSSLPAMSKIKSKKSASTSKPSDKVSKETKSTGADNDSESSINQSTKENSSHSNEDNLKSVNRKVVEDGNKHIKKSPSRERSKIPSLLHFRSPSASRELEKGRSYGSSNKEEASGVTVRRSQSISSSSTPDRSILSKFFRQGSEEKESSKGTEIPGDDKDGSKKKRRISRFLRPDFFDTPREESAYAKKKDAKKAAEAESKLKSKNIVKKVDCNPSLSQTNMPELQVASTSLNGNGISTEESCMDNVSTAITETKKDIKLNKKNGKQMKPAADIKQNSNNNKLATESPAFEKQTTNSNNKSGFLVSLERKLEKFRSSGDDIPSASNSGKSRVDKAIRSLREQSQFHNRSDMVTSESNLLKRAVSVGDCCTIESPPKENSNSKIGGKVTSVLGFLRKLEDTPGKNNQGPPPTTSALSRLRRTQSVYAGSQSDSILSDSKESMYISNEGKTKPLVNEKVNDSNASVICNKSNKGINSLQRNVQTDLNSGNSGIVDTNVENCSKPQSSFTIIGGTATSGKSTENSAELTKYESMPTSLKESFSKSGTRENVKSKLKIKQEPCNELKKELEVNTKQLLKNNNEIDTNSSEAVVIVPKPSLNDDFKSSEVTAKPSSAQTDTMSVSTKAAPNSALLDVQERGQKNTSSSLDYEAKETRESAMNLNKKTNAIIQQGSSQEEKIPYNSHELLNNDTGNESSEENTKKDIFIKTADTQNADDESILSNLPNEMNELPCDDYGLNDDEIKFANVKQLDSCSYPGDESSLISPAESESIDSWSVCSDFDTHDFPPSPIPPLGEEESVVDRIRRKSFYSRFNDIKKKHRKTSLSSLSSYPSSYREQNSLYHHQNHPRKKDYHADYILSPSHSSGYYHDKPSRSQSLYAQNDYDTKPTILNRKSPLLVKSQLSSQGDINSRNLDSELDIYDVNDDMEKINSAERDFGEFNQKTASYGNEAGKNIHSLGGSMETLRMPRYFNNNGYLGASSVPTPSYTCPVRRASDSHISESAKYNIGSIIPKSQLPVSSRIPNINIGSAFTSHSGNDMRGGETFPARAKYNRFKSHHSPDMPPPLHVVSSAGEEEISRVESERPVTPR